MAANTLTVPATRGKMGTSEYYTANFPMGMVVKLFEYDPEQMAEMPVEFRHQRLLKKARVPDIADYMVDNEDYIFSSITTSVDAGELVFKESEIDPNVGLLELPMDAEWIVNDGQHRVAGIAEAIKREPTFRYDSISVVILPARDLERNQQVFSDLNRTVHKTSKSLDILFDHRAPINRITNACVDRVRLFKGRTDKEHVSLALRSSDFATLSGVQVATHQLLGDLSDKLGQEEYQKLENLAVGFWEHVTDVVTPWADIASGDLKASEARVDYLSSYALALWGVGSVGHTAIKAGGDWKTRLEALRSVDWLKTNPEWQGICMHGGEVITRGPTRKATGDLLRWKLGLGSKPEAVIG
ncbi:MAG: DNA sulfur modification protein DndB [Acidimicrobiia bacterium]